MQLRIPCWYSLLLAARWMKCIDWMVNPFSVDSMHAPVDMKMKCWPRKYERMLNVLLICESVITPGYHDHNDDVLGWWWLLTSCVYERMCELARWHVAVAYELLLCASDIDQLSSKYECVCLPKDCVVNVTKKWWNYQTNDEWWWSGISCAQWLLTMTMTMTIPMTHPVCVLWIPSCVRMCLMTPNVWMNAQKWRQLQWCVMYANRVDGFAGPETKKCPKNVFEFEWPTLDAMNSSSNLLPMQHHEDVCACVFNAKPKWWNSLRMQRHEKMCV